MPYRIPGAIDRDRWPVLQILHLEKRGLQFHERCVSINDYRLPRPVYFSSADRRWFQYKFEERTTEERLPPNIAERVRELLLSAARSKKQSDAIGPIRDWNADSWYVFGQGTGRRFYNTKMGSAPPHEMVDLFNELNAIPHSTDRKSELRDICLGFCYDPLSAMGWLYA